jgi:hypothetical protein
MVPIALSDVWPRYPGSPRDQLRLEICDPWLEQR